DHEATQTPQKVEGPLSSISLNYAIPWFLLFRLMVKFEATPPKNPEKAQAADQDAPAAKQPKALFRAELIDISIPRRDTVEAIEQWDRVRDQIENVKGVYVPGYAYYIDEYILMAREVYARRSRSVDKFLSRMPRAYMMAATKNERF